MALSVTKLTWGFSIIALLSAAGAAYEFNRIRQIDNFNAAVIAARSPYWMTLSCRDWSLPPPTRKRKKSRRPATRKFLKKNNWNANELKQSAESRTSSARNMKRTSKPTSPSKSRASRVSG